MNDPQNKYINAYIDHSIGLIHEYLATILQIKSQLRVANEVISDKDKFITILQKELEEAKSGQNDKSIAIQNAKKWENDYNAMKNKVSHMDTLIQQMNSMKKLILEKESEIGVKNTEIDKLLAKIADLQSPKKTINRKKPKVLEEVQKELKSEPEPLPLEVLQTENVMKEVPLELVLPVVQEQTKELVTEKTDDF